MKRKSIAVLAVLLAAFSLGSCAITSAKQKLAIGNELQCGPVATTGGNIALVPVGDKAKQALFRFDWSTRPGAGSGADLQFGRNCRVDQEWAMLYGPAERKVFVSLETESGREYKFRVIKAPISPSIMKVRVSDDETIAFLYYGGEAQQMAFAQRR